MTVAVDTTYTSSYRVSAKSAKPLRYNGQAIHDPRDNELSGRQSTGPERADQAVIPASSIAIDSVCLLQAVGPDDILVQSVVYNFTGIDG